MLNTPHISFFPFPVSVPIHQEFLKAPPKSVSALGVPFLRQVVIRPRVLQMITLGHLGGNIRSVLGAALQLLIHSFKNMRWALAVCHEWLGNGYEAPHHRSGPGRCRQTSWWGSFTKTLWIRLGFWSRAVWHPLQPIDAAFCDSSVPPWSFSRC